METGAATSPTFYNQEEDCQYSTMNEPSAAFRATEPCRIVVADDHAIIRDGLTAILADAGGFDVVGTACDGKAAIEAVGQLKPDLLVIDLTMPHTDGAEAIRVIKRRFPHVRVVVLTYHKEDTYIHAAIMSGMTIPIRRMRPRCCAVDVVAALASRTPRPHSSGRWVSRRAR